jgi:transposase
VIGHNTFHHVGLNKLVVIILRQKFSRRQLEARLANLPPRLVGMEACVGARPRLQTDAGRYVV